MKYLFISAHADDCELSCGGTMAKLAAHGHEVTHIALSLCNNDSLLSEFIDASKVLNVSKVWTENHTVREFHLEIERIANYFHQLNGNYDHVITHSSNDKHIDHRTVGEQAIRIFNRGSLSTFIAPHNGTEIVNWISEIEQSYMNKKIEALMCYKSQSYRAYMKPEFVRAMATYNGIKANVQYAEAFQILRRME